MIKSSFVAKKITCSKGGAFMGRKNYAYINPQMLVWARSETPFATTEAVEMLFPAITAKNLDAWESGVEYPSITEAKKLAGIYKLPFATFYLSEEPAKKVKKYTDRRTLKGFYSEDISYALWSEIQRIESNRDSILEFSDDEAPVRNIPSIADNNVIGIATAIRNYFGLETPLRSKTAYGNNPFNYYRNIVERNGIIVTQVSGVDIEEMKGLSIYFDIYPIVAINNKDYDRSKVFSLFHELAHIFRRSSSLCTIDMDEHSDQEETICDRIAAAALMPEIAFKKIAEECIARVGGINSICIDRIAGRFGVSTLSALRRMFETKVINRKAFFDLLDVITEEYNANIAHIEAVRRGKNVPVFYHVKYLNQNGFLLPRTVLSAYATGKITHGEMCKALGVNSKHIGSIEQAVMFK